MLCVHRSIDHQQQHQPVYQVTISVHRPGSVAVQTPQWNNEQWIAPGPAVSQSFNRLQDIPYYHSGPQANQCQVRHSTSASIYIASNSSELNRTKATKWVSTCWNAVCVPHSANFSPAVRGWQVPAPPPRPLASAIDFPPDPITSTICSSRWIPIRWVFWFGVCYCSIHHSTQDHTHIPSMKLILGPVPGHTQSSVILFKSNCDVGDTYFTRLLQFDSVECQGHSTGWAGPCHVDDEWWRDAGNIVCSERV